MITSFDVRYIYHMHKYTLIYVAISLCHTLLGFVMFLYPYPVVSVSHVRVHCLRMLSITNLEGAQRENKMN